MGYLGLGAGMGAGLGAPSAAPGAGSIGAPPPPVPSTEPPPYDVLQDPSWKGLVGPNEHAWRNFLNELSPEHRQMLLQKAMQLKAGNRPAGPPPQAGPMPGPPMPPQSTPIGPGII